MVSRETSSRLGDDVRVRQFVLVGCLHDLIDDIVDIFLDRIVDRRAVGCRACSIVIDAEAATSIDELNIEAEQAELNVELRSLADGSLDVTDIGHLAAYVEMNELEAILQVVSLKVFESLEQFG